MKTYQFKQIITNTQWDTAPDKVDLIEGIAYDAIRMAMSEEHIPPTPSALKDVSMEIVNNYEEDWLDTKTVIVNVYYEDVL